MILFINEKTLSESSDSFQNFFEINANSDFEYGYVSGLKFYKFYHFLFNLLYRTSDYYKKIGFFEEINCISEKYHPEYVHELKGLSKSTNINVSNLLALQGFLSIIFNPQCTITLASKSATKNNETFLTQNWDLDSTNPYFYILRYFYSKILFQSQIKSSYSYLFIGIPVLYEYPLLNEKGLGWGGAGTHLTNNNSREIDTGIGLSPYLLMRKSMKNCRNISEVADLWDYNVRSSLPNKLLHHNWDYDTYAFCDKKGDILIIEQTHSYIATVNKNPFTTNNQENILWHTNHHVWLNPNKTGSIFPDEDQRGNNSNLRFKRAEELLTKHYGNITIDILKNLTRDHGKGKKEDIPDSSDICRHADSNDSYATAISWIIQPKTLTIYLTNTAPCHGNFKCYNCARLFADGTS